jgi:hypothetical protein
MSTNFIINPKSVSFTEAKTDIENWLGTRPDALKWEDFFQASAGQTVVELLAGVSTFIAYQVITGRREAYLPYAENRSSGVAIASQLGYSVFRGSNANVRLTINPSTTVTYQKGAIIGAVLDFDLIVKESIICNAGENTPVECVVGFLRTETVTVNSNLLQTFRFNSANVSEDIRMYLDNVEIFPTKNLVDLITDEFVTLSNATGGLDLFYLNRGSLQYVTGSQFVLEYVELANPEFTTNDVTSDEQTITNIEISKVYEEEESLREIKVNAPLYNETKFVIKGREDYEKIFVALSTDIISSNGRDYSPAVVQLAYLRENLNMFTEAEKLDFQDAMLKARPFGVQPALITDPMFSKLKLDITIFLKEKTNENVLGMVDGILASKEKKLGETLDLFSIENAIERNSYVKTSRVTPALSMWESEEFYGGRKFIEIASNNDVIFEFAGHIRKSGLTEPTWTTNIGDTFIDNDIVWECRVDYRQNFQQWQADAEYSEDDIVVPTILNGFVYVAIATINRSGLIEPDWPTELIEVVDDNEIVWRAVSLVGTPDIWQPDNIYKIGDTVVPSSGGTLAYQVVAYRSKSGAIEPTWNTSFGFTTSDGRVRWIARSPFDNIIRTNWNEYLLIDRVVNVTLQIIN